MQETRGYVTSFGALLAGKGLLHFYWHQQSSKYFVFTTILIRPIEMPSSGNWQIIES
jgi:hypothetical protein